MSRSRRKSPYCSITCTGYNNSEKWDKQKANRRFRHRAKREIREGKEPVTLMNEVSNVWDFLKDGRMELNPSNPEDQRLMRK